MFIEISLAQGQKARRKWWMENCAILVSKMNRTLKISGLNSDVYLIFIMHEKFLKYTHTLIIF